MQILESNVYGAPFIRLDDGIVVSIVGYGESNPDLPLNSGAIKIKTKNEIFDVNETEYIVAFLTRKLVKLEKKQVLIVSDSPYWIEQVRRLIGRSVAHQ